MKVYVIGEGEYSDFRVIGVFSNLPEKYNKENCPLQISVEEFELDIDLLPDWKYFPYVVRTDISTGSLVIQSKSIAYFDSSQEIKDKNIVTLHKPRYYNEDNLITKFDWLRVIVDAKDNKHAIKIATDLFAQYLVEKEILGR